MPFSHLRGKLLWLLFALELLFLLVSVAYREKDSMAYRVQYSTSQLIMYWHPVCGFKPVSLGH
jgi:hypothetical protein